MNRMTIFLLVLNLSLVWGLNSQARKYPPSHYKNSFGNVIQFLSDPHYSKRGWALTSKGLFYNNKLPKNENWKLKFSPKDFQKLTKDGLKSNFKFIKISPFNKKKRSYILLVQNGQGTAHRFITSDYGHKWKHLKKDKGNIPRKTDNKENNKARPLFKIYFDLLLHLRPGVTPWTFDNYHSVLVFNYAPLKQLNFATEVNPTPRFFQVDYAFTKSFAVYLGKIVIPFDDPNPHNKYGGYLYTSETAPPNAPAFLPDIWADLGVGMKYRFYQTPSLSLAFYLYITNGFQKGGTDPWNEAPSYPDFSTVPLKDNNTDKAIGGRIEARVLKFLKGGISFYTNRYTDNAEEPRRIYMLGADSKLWIQKGTSFKLGYIFSLITLPNVSSSNNFQRASLCGELKHFFSPHWYGVLQGGIIQTDDRIMDAGDQNKLGIKIGYRTKIFDFSLQYQKDLKKTPQKTTFDYTAFRIAVSL